jgi:hypothetical protein
MSFGRRLELAERIRALGAELEYREAGDGIRDKIEATLIASRIDRVYLSWGLAEVRGLTIDGDCATDESLFEAGPEELTREILRCIKAECGLTDQDRKTS